MFDSEAEYGEDEIGEDAFDVPEIRIEEPDIEIKQPHHLPELKKT
jgi:hypothetical protein